MLKALFTLDYEIHGNGEGCPHELMVEPTDRLLRLFDQYGAKLTIMADVAEILKFREYAEQQGKDDYHYHAIINQLREAVQRGHDVQLHLHSSYFRARHDGRRWVQDWSEYNFAGLSFERLNELIRIGKAFLEFVLHPVKPDYRCLAFRAANWSVSPSANVVKALVANRIRIDTSVFKFGRRDGLVKFNYSDAHSELIPWQANADNLCLQDANGAVWEYPIYSEERWLGPFLTPNRVCRAVGSRLHRIGVATDGIPSNRDTGSLKRPSPIDKLLMVTRKHAWKADFNQCTGRQLIGALQRAELKCSTVAGDIPFVLIGHSKLFNRLNESSLRPFLKFIQEKADRFGFATFAFFEDRNERHTFRPLEPRRVEPGSGPGIACPVKG